MPGDEPYLTHRPLVLRLAYDITGSWSDAEDVAQQTWVRWNGVDTEVRNARAYLARIATHLALDVVARRDTVGYPGPFLPEPVPTGPGADAIVELADEVEIALMVVLGTLSPLERAAFLLHDVFAFTHEEVADMLGRAPAAVRQLASRARRRVHDRREPAPPEVDGEELRRLTERFLAAAQQGDLTALRAFLTDDVVFVGDGGGQVRSVRRPVEGSDNVARLVVGLATNLDAAGRFEVVEVNHRPALTFRLGGALDSVIWLLLRDGRISQILAVRNPAKLAAIGKQREHPTHDEPDNGRRRSS